MSIISCPECAKDVSDSAVTCPNCGFGVRDYVLKQKKILEIQISSEQEAIALVKKQMEEKKKSEQLKAQKLVDIKNEKYDHAKKLFNSQSVANIKESKIIFQELGNWKDSEQYLEQFVTRLAEAEVQEKDRIERQKRIKQKKRNLLYIVIAIVIIAIISIIYIPKIHSLFLISSQYNKAQSCAQEHNYNEAIRLLSEINSYKNSQELITEYSYLNAELFFANCDYINAIEAFSALKTYKNSQKYLKKSVILLSKEYYESGKFTDCINLCEKYNDTNNDYYLKSLYEQGKKHFENKEYNLAINYLKNTNQYLDTKDMIKHCQQQLNYEKAIQLMSTGDLREAQDIFVNLKDFQQANLYAETCKKYVDFCGVWKSKSHISYYDDGTSNNFGAMSSDDITVNICVDEKFSVNITVQTYVLTEPQKLELLTYHPAVNGLTLSWSQFSDDNVFDLKTGKRTETSKYIRAVLTYDKPKAD